MRQRRLPAPWAYKRRISELGPLEPRSKQYRHQFRRAVGYLAYEAAVLRPVDVNVADVLLELTHGGRRDYRTTEAQIAAQLPPKPSGRAVSKRIASDALDRLRAAGLVDWDHGTARTSTTTGVEPCSTVAGKARRPTGC